MKKWFSIVLSDDASASLRRFVGLQSFYLIAAILIVCLTLLFRRDITKELIALLTQIEFHLWVIVMCIIVAVSVTDIAKLVYTPSQLLPPSTTEEENIENKENPI